MMPVRLEPVIPRSRVKQSTTEPLCSILNNEYLLPNAFVIGAKKCSYNLIGKLLLLSSVC